MRAFNFLQAFLEDSLGKLFWVSQSKGNYFIIGVGGGGGVLSSGNFYIRANLNRANPSTPAVFFVFC